MNETTQELVAVLLGIADAAQAVVDRWERGDLAGAVNNLEGWIDDAHQAVEKVAEEA